MHAANTIGPWKSVLAVLALAALPAAGAGPFTIVRVSDPATAASAPAHALVGVAPYDDPAALHDGNSYYYLVKDSADVSLVLSVSRNDVTGAVRIGFADGDPGSAGVDPTLSEVTVHPASIPADGATMAWVEVRPRDADGVLLGAGLTVAADDTALLPGVKATAVPFDHGDGSYSLPVVSATPGDGTVRVSVEGLVLAAQPALDYALVGPSVCGDGYVDTATGEQCDDGNFSNADACPTSCQPASCGDGFTRSGVEECDGGPGCNPDCTIACGAGGNIDNCTPGEALVVIIAEMDDFVDLDPESDVSDKLEDAINKLNDAQKELNDGKHDAAADKIEDALVEIHAALSYGLDPQWAESLEERLLRIVDWLRDM